ncbi:putative lipase atg15 [Globomyces sp. JEL0801]|nr:putative lipase atg15 [Globomyces sp. JEL0801]
MNFLFCLIWQLVASREFGRFKAVHHLKAQVVNDEIGVFYQPNFAKNAMDSAKGDGQNWSGNVRFRKRSFHQRPLNFQNNQPNQFDFEDHHLPDHTDPETVLALAQMTYDAYFDTNDSHWTTRFGFDSGAIRGYVFEDDLEETLVIVIKGTSLATPIGSGPTAVLVLRF